MSWRAAAASVRTMTSTTMASASQSRPRIALILFDAFDTLVKPRISPHEQYDEEARRHGLGEYLDTGSGGTDGVDRLPIKDAFRQSFKQLAKNYPLYGLHTGLASSDVWWTMLIEQTMLHSGVPTQAVDASMPKLGPALLHRFASKEAYELVPGALEALQALSSLSAALPSSQKATPIALSMATNSDSRILLACKALGLGKYLDLDVTYDEEREPTEVTQAGEQIATQREVPRKAVSGPTLSYDVGYEKPDARFFHAAVQRAYPKAETSEDMSIEEMCRHTLYVGDSYKEDYIGATQAGLQAVWLQRAQPALQAEDGTPILSAKSLQDVVCIVEEAQGS